MTAERSDMLIGDEVVRALGQQGRYSQVLAQVKDGKVTLSGDVPSGAVKQEVETLVAGIEGVREMRSHLNIDSGSDSFGPPGEAVRDDPDGGGDGRVLDIDLGQGS